MHECARIVNRIKQDPQASQIVLNKLQDKGFLKKNELSNIGVDPFHESILPHIFAKRRA